MSLSNIDVKQVLNDLLKLLEQLDVEIVNLFSLW
jgi:hypothetical protein